MNHNKFFNYKMNKLKSLRLSIKLKSVIQKKVNLFKLKILIKKYKNIFQKKKFNFFFFLNKLFNSLSKEGKKNTLIVYFFKIFNILIFKNKKNFKNKSFFIYVYFLQIAIKLLPSFVYINKNFRGKTIILPWIKKNKKKNKKKLVIIGSIWFKKSLKNRKEKTFFLKIISELESIRSGKSESMLYKNLYYKNFIYNKRHLKFLKKRLWI